MGTKIRITDGQNTKLQAPNPKKHELQYETGR